MTVVQQLEAAAQFEKLWAALMPELNPPGSDQFAIWTGNYPHELVSRGINRAAGKFRKMRQSEIPLTREAATRYASSVMRNEALGIRAHPNGCAPRKSLTQCQEIICPLEGR